MELKIEFFGSLCAASTFEINGIKASHLDFGNKGDTSPESAPDYGGCGNMKFITKPCTGEVLKKYGITPREYRFICKQLKENLSFGCCALCS